MSYCRWSSDDHACDLYVWADVAGGYRSEVAGRRRVFKVDMPPPVTLPIGEAGSEERHEWVQAWMERNLLVNDIVDDESKFDWLDLPEPEGGRSYWHDTAEECAANLERLRDAEFNVPQSAIDALHDEARPSAATETPPCDAAERSTP